MTTLDRLEQGYEIAAAVRARPRHEAGGEHGPAEHRLLFSPLREGVRVRLDRQAARALLAGTLRDPERIRALRRLLAGQGGRVEVARMTDHEVVDRVAALVASGALHVHRAPVPALRFHYEPPDQIVEDPLGPAEEVESEFLVGDLDALSEPEEIVPLIEAEPEPAFIEPSFDAPPEPTETDDLDAAMQADALRDAAQTGVPFCEECEKARLAAEAPPEEEKDLATVAPDEQASTLLDAAQAGAPFCEECEKAKQAAAAEKGA